MTKDSLESQLTEARKKLKNAKSPASKAVLEALIKALLAVIAQFFPEKTRPQLELGFAPKTSRRAPAKAK